MKLLKFFDFILESRTKPLLPVIFSDSFKDKIDEIGNSYIASYFREMYFETQLKEFTFISVGATDDTVTYIDSKKVVDYLKNQDGKIDPITYLNWLIKSKEKDENIELLSKTEIKVGRFINKFFPNTFTDKAIEDFVNKWKSVTETGSKFEVWSGVDIKKAYMSNNYHFSPNNSNPLMNSCMNDQLDIVEFYSYCPSCSVVVLLDKENHILGRALLWKDHENRMIMDRVYYVYDKDYYKFIRLANDHEWYYKKTNVSGFSRFAKNGQDHSLRSKVRVPDVFKFKDEGFPYMDTFYYAQGEWAMNYEPLGSYLKLIDTEGGYEEYIDNENDN